MKTISKSLLQKTTLGFVALFILLFGFRLWYGYTKPIQAEFQQPTWTVGEFVSIRKNYATKQYKNINTHLVQVDQKYEKIAQITSQSTVFKQDENQVRRYIKSTQSLIQFEQKNGNNGNRQLTLTIGVPPNHFDQLYKNLSKIGNVQAKQITKKDKTNEYRELNAKKASLEKLRNSLVALKNKGGKIKEYIQLENRILETEEQLQNIGVNLGDFDSENEFCTVNFSISEIAIRHIGLAQRTKIALEWTAKTFFRITMSFLFVIGIVYLILKIIKKVK